MKKNIIIISILFLALTIHQTKAQDFEPTQIKVLYGQDSIYMNSNDSRFKENKFMLGWHWGNGPTISRALKMSQVHELTGEYDGSGDTLRNYSDSLYPDSIDLVMNTPIIGHNWSKFNLSEGISMQWEPTLKIIDEGEFKTNEGDPTNPVFGFKTIIGEILTDVNGNKRLLLDSRLNTNTVVLQDNFPNDEFFQVIDTSKYRDNDEVGQNHEVGHEDDHLRYRPIMNKPIFYRDYNGTDLYLTINMRREDNSIVQDTNTVLEIRVKYILNNGDSNYVRFEEQPALDKMYFYQLPYNRGIAKISTPSSLKLNKMLIKSTHLPIVGQFERKDITISAKMIFDGQINEPLFHSPRFRAKENDITEDKIKSLKIEVVYTDTTLPISIDWIRIESKVAQDIYRGVYDSVLAAVVRSTISHFTTDSFRLRGIRPFRFYLRDEHFPMHWGIHRYMQKLIGNIGQNETGLERYPLQRMHK